MRNLAFAACAFCVLVGSFGAYGILQGPYVGAEYEAAGEVLRIARIAAGSPAERAGLPVGGRLLSIAGVPIGRWDLEDDMDVIPDRAGLLSNFATQARLGALLRPGLPVLYRVLSPAGGEQEMTLTPGRMPLSRALAELSRLFLPAIFTASDGRGFHDVLAGTVLVRR